SWRRLLSGLVRTLTLLVARESIAFASDESLWLAQKCCLALHSRDCRNSFHNVRPRLLLPHVRMSAIAETEQILEEQTSFLSRIGTEKELEKALVACHSRHQ